MQAALSLDYAAHLSRLERKGGVLKLLLHVALAKVSQVAPLARAAAVALGQGELAEADVAALDAGLVGLDDVAGVVLGAGDFALAPRGRAARVPVLDQQVGGADLVGRLGHGGARRGRAVVYGHVFLELLRVRVGRRLPARDLLGGVEVIGEVLGVAVAHLPARGESRLVLFSGGRKWPVSPCCARKKDKEPEQWRGIAQGQSKTGCLQILCRALESRNVLTAILVVVCRVWKF